MNAFAVTKTAIDYKRNPNAWTDQESAAQIYNLKNMSFYLYFLGILLSISFITLIFEHFYSNGIYDKIYAKSMAFSVEISLYVAKAKMALDTKMRKVRNKTIFIGSILFVLLCITWAGVHLHYKGKFMGKKFGA